MTDPNRFLCTSTAKTVFEAEFFLATIETGISPFRYPGHRARRHFDGVEALQLQSSA